MKEEMLDVIFRVGYYGALLIWIFLLLVIGIRIVKRNYGEIKIPALYLFNSLTLIIAYGLVLKLALIVMAPHGETKEISISMLRNIADDYLSDFILFSLATTCILSIVNFLYIKYMKINILKHMLILSMANLTILLLASYLSTEAFYQGLLQEIYSRFN